MQNTNLSGSENNGEAAEAKPACVALVPVVAALRRPAPITHGLTRPDASFVTHLIAMAEHSPQTRTLRRAAPELTRRFGVLYRLGVASPQISLTLSRIELVVR